MIAIVDDDPGVRKALQRLLCSAGFVVEAFACGEDFIRSAREGSPDCLLLDLHLPGLNGLEVLHRLVARGADFPVIVITGTDRLDLAESTLAAGANALLLKPLEDAELLDTVTKALQE